LCQRSPQTGQPGSNQTSQSIFVSSHFHSKKLPVTLCYGAFWNENAYFVYANSVAGSIRPFVAGFQVTGDTFWGGYSGYFSDPDGFLWEIAWNPSFPIAEDGSIRVSG
jgi:uncharacterized glyoxalase superfamily protein PhnB